MPARSTVQSGRASVAGRVGDGDAGACGAIVERQDFQSLASRADFAVSSASPSASGFLPAGLGQRRPAAAPAADVFRRVADERDRVHPLVGERLVEIEDEKGSAVVCRPEQHGCGAFLLPDPVCEVAQVAARHAPRLDDDDVAVARADLEVGLGLLRRLIRLLARALELDAELFRLVRTCAQAARRPHPP